MYTPTTFQAHLLRAVQNLALDTAEKRSRPGATPMLSAQITTGDATVAELGAVAVAVGIPRSWVDYVQVAGQQGQRWRPDQQMLSGQHSTRSELVTAYTARIRDLQQIVGTAAAYARRGTPGPEAAAKVCQIIGITWQCAGAVGHALSLTREERRQCWQPGSQQWTSAVAATIDSLDDDALIRRWKAICSRDFTPLAVPIIVLQGAGITHDDIARQLPLSPDQMVDHTAIALSGPRRTPTVDIAIDNAEREGAAITSAIDAAGLTTSPTLFSVLDRAPTDGSESHGADTEATP